MIGGRNPQDQFLGVGLGVLDVDVEPAAGGEDAGVDQLVFRPVPRPALVLGHELLVGERPLGVAVAQMHEGVGGRVVDVEPVLLGILAMVPLQRGEPEQPLLEVRIGPVPEGGGQAEELEAIGNPGDAVLTPAVGLRP